jgi:hypothetical protein
MAKEYEVGYRRPPAAGQFKKGQSGNPKGRPKGSLSLGQELKKALLEKTSIKTDGGTMEISVLNAMIKKCLSEMCKGNMKAAEILSDLLKFAATMPAGNDNQEEASADQDILQAHDEKIMARIRKGPDRDR